ncbi:MAG: CPBP family intramembrane metalloprotease, partial [Lachnospiraceae bacterium]|nr:CPBP family intramembrane metalloprotease [Lachnospiraceae bacterium]
VLSLWFPENSSSVNEEFVTMLEGVPFVAALLLIALMPAVCEEMMFRGYLYAAFRQKMGMTRVILLVSLLFGFSHMSLIRFLPTMLLGIALAYARYRSDSLLVSALMHFLNNAYSVCILYYGDTIEWLKDEKMGIPLIAGLVVMAVIGIPAGAGILKGSAQ